MGVLLTGLKPPRGCTLTRVLPEGVGDRIVFGELTSYPGAGKVSFDPASFDGELGAWWTPPKRYR